jgi:hypothetical protein
MTVEQRLYTIRDLGKPWSEVKRGVLDNLRGTDVVVLRSMGFPMDVLLELSEMPTFRDAGLLLNIVRFHMYIFPFLTGKLLRDSSAQPSAQTGCYPYPVPPLTSGPKRSLSPLAPVCCAARGT